jgi:hypothetical protein
MNNPWDPVTQDIVFLIEQIRDASIYGHFTNKPIPQHDLITAGERAIVNSGVFTNQYADWAARPADQRQWSDFETFCFWTEKYDVWVETSRTTAQAGFGGNATSESNSNSDTIDAEYAESLCQFGSVNEHNAATFNNMAATNNQLLSNITPTLQQLKAQLDGLAMAVQARPPAPAPAPVPYQAPPPAYAPPPAPPAPYQAPYYLPPQQYGRGGGRGNSRGRGRGRGHGYNNNNYGQQQQYGQQYGQQQGQQYGQQQMQQQPGNQFQQRAPNNKKYFPNWNYCWSHGYDLADWHMSHCCPEPNSPDMCIMQPAKILAMEAPKRCTRRSGPDW